MFFPYEELAPLKQLRHLDLSKNRIVQVPPVTNIPGIRMSLDMLRLEYNSITFLLPGSFQLFNTLNTTILDGNPISYIKVSTNYIKVYYLESNRGKSEVHFIIL